MTLRDLLAFKVGVRIEIKIGGEVDNEISGRINIRKDLILRVGSFRWSSSPGYVYTVEPR